MPTTTNFGWTTPADTDLVKDGAAAIRTALNGVDTSFLDLKGGTTGQVLAKATNTDLDFTWVAQDDSNAIQNALLTTTGDTIYASGASTPARLGIGTSGQVLTVSGGVPSWATPTAATDNFQLINAGGTALTGAATITVSGISGKNSLMVWVDAASSASASSYFYIRFNTDSTSNYTWAGLAKQNATMTEVRTAPTDTEIEWARQGTAVGNSVYGYVKIDGTNASGAKPFVSTSSAGGGTPGDSNVLSGLYLGTSAISSVSIISTVGNFDAGTIYVYGA